ncbi:MAG: HPr-rel-A system PqqD family peptide chaperone [Gammaproteobacteria bacterium]
MTVPIDYSDAKWLAASSDDLLWAEWGGDHVAFHRPSGSTHLLNAASRHLLTSVLTKPLSANEIARVLAEGDESDLDSQYVDDIEAMLDRFEQLGLVDRT